MNTTTVSVGDVVQSVTATGSLEAVSTVDVGSQVSGTIASLSADFNSVVTRGQLLAELDPSLLHAQSEQARASLQSADATVDRFQVTLEDARAKAARSEELSARQLITASDLDAARVAVRMAAAQLRAGEAQRVQADAALRQCEVNERHARIYSPIDGIVISRSVDVGQTVAASMQAPTLFAIATDLSRLRLKASVSESDIGLVREGQAVTFRVDVYSGETFTGSVTQVRLQPTTTQNVVSYTTIIDVPNTGLRLRPGMTATTTIEIARADGVVRVPNTALRFRPTAAVFTALGQPQPAGPATRSGGQPGSAAGGCGSSRRGMGVGQRAARAGAADHGHQRRHVYPNRQWRPVSERATRNQPDTADGREGCFFLHRVAFDAAERPAAASRRNGWAAAIMPAVQGYKGARVHGCTGARVQGARVQGCTVGQASRLSHGCKGGDKV